MQFLGFQNAQMCFVVVGVSVLGVSSLESLASKAPVRVKKSHNLPGCALCTLVNTHLRAENVSVLRNREVSLLQWLSECTFVCVVIWDPGLPSVKWRCPLFGGPCIKDDKAKCHHTYASLGSWAGLRMYDIADISLTEGNWSKRHEGLSSMLS